MKGDYADASHLADDVSDTSIYGNVNVDNYEAY
jgi:hypothetical protein